MKDKKEPKENSQGKAQGREAGKAEEQDPRKHRKGELTSRWHIHDDLDASIMGEMIQMDASEFVWAPWKPVNGIYMWLSMMPREKSSVLILTYQETLNGYYQVA